MSSSIVLSMMTLRDQVKLYHWQTLRFPRHKATDDLVGQLDTNIDKFVEVYIGKYGRPSIKGASLKLRGFTDREAPQMLKEAAEWLSHSLPKKLKKTDTELLNIRDEILADIEQAMYLFTLR
jgi:hypothetical protein